MRQPAMIALALIAAAAPAAAQEGPAIAQRAEPAPDAAGFKPFMGALYRVVSASIVGDDVEAVMEVRNPKAHAILIDATGFHVSLIDEDGLGTMAQNALQLGSRAFADLNGIPSGAVRRFRFVILRAPNHGGLKTLALSLSWGGPRHESGSANTIWPITVAGDPVPPPVQATPGRGGFTRAGSWEVRIDAIHQDVDKAAELFFTVRNPHVSPVRVGGAEIEFVGTGANGKPAISWNRTFSIRGQRRLYDYDLWLLPGGEARLRKFFGASPTVSGPFTVGRHGGNTKVPIPAPGAPALRDPAAPAQEPVW